MKLSEDEKKVLKRMLNEPIGEPGGTVFRMVEALIPIEYRSPADYAAFERASQSIGEDGFTQLDGDILSARDYKRLLTGIRLVKEWAEKDIVGRSQEIGFEKNIGKARESLTKAITSLSELQRDQAKTLSAGWAHSHVKNVMVKEMRRLGMKEAGQENTLENEEMHTRNNSKMIFTMTRDNVDACFKMLNIFDSALAILNQKRSISPQFRRE